MNKEDKTNALKKLKELKRDCDRECRINFLGGFERSSDRCDCGAEKHNEMIEWVERIIKRG